MRLKFGVPAIVVDVKDSDTQWKKQSPSPGIGNRAKPKAFKTLVNLALQFPVSDLEERKLDENSKRVLPVH